MAYADHEFYTTEYRHGYMEGAIDPAEKFGFLAEQATLYVRSVTEGISDKVQSDDLTAVKNATCAIAEILQDESNITTATYSGGAKLSSESVGNWSRSYSTASMNGTEVEYLEKRKLDALMLWLGSLSAFAPIFKVRSYPNIPRGCRRG